MSVKLTDFTDLLFLFICHGSESPCEIVKSIDQQRIRAAANKHEIRSSIRQIGFLSEIAICTSPNTSYDLSLLQD